MKTNELIKSADSIYRILSIDGDTAIVLDCIKMTMPVLMPISSLTDCPTISEDELHVSLGIHIREESDLSPAERKSMHERYTLIAPILPFVSDVQMRSMMITRVYEQSGVGKQTVRKYLCRFLALQRMEVLAPDKKDEDEKKLTEDERNFRWALNRFYYTQRKVKLTYAYTMMLKERYTDTSGQLRDGYPPFHRFKYYYSRHKRSDSALISRNGLTCYQRNDRPLLGSVRDFAPTVGVGLLDSTVCDIYLVNEACQLVGRPILTLCVDAYSSLICGYHLSWEGGVYSLQQLMRNVITDKAEWCSRFGVQITSEQWPCAQLPGVLVTDKGREYTGSTFEQITELGVQLVNLPPYRPELKGLVEHAFHLLQESYKPHLKGRGVVEPDFQERGAHDYRRDACLTIMDFEAILIRCIIHYNSHRVLGESMTVPGISPYASAVWSDGISRPGSNLISVSAEQMRLTLLPRTVGRYTRRGLMVNGQRYRNREGDYTRRYLEGDNCSVAYNPDDAGTIWVVDDGTYSEFEVILAVYDGMSLNEIEEMRQQQKADREEQEKEHRQSLVDLASHIETIANGRRHPGSPDLHGIRDRHAMEKKKRRLKNG